MAILTTTGLELEAGSISKPEFIRMANFHAEPIIKIRNKQILIEEQLTVLPSRMSIAMIHRPMDEGARATAMSAVQPTRKYTLVAMGSEVEGLTIGDELLLDWDNSVALKRVNLKESEVNLITLSAAFSAMKYGDRTEVIAANKPLQVYEYLMGSDYVVLGSYSPTEED